MDAIQAGAENMLRRYEDLCRLIRGVLNLDQPNAAGGTAAPPPELSREAFLQSLSEVKERIQTFEMESAREILEPLAALPADSLTALKPSAISAEALSEALGDIRHALEEFDGFAAEEQVNALPEQY